MVWIFFIFAVTGSTTVIVRKSVFRLLGVDIEHPVLAWFVKLVAIYLFYQLLLLLIGSLLGEHRFFRWFLIQMNRKLIPGNKK